MSDFDDIFKDSFQDFEMDVPDDMWSRIQDAQDPEDVNHPFWYTNKLWLSTLIIIGLSVFGFSLYYFQDQEQIQGSITSSDIPELIVKKEGTNFKTLLLPSSEKRNEPNKEFSTRRNFNSKVPPTSEIVQSGENNILNNVVLIQEKSNEFASDGIQTLDSEIFQSNDFLSELIQSPSIRHLDNNEKEVISSEIGFPPNYDTQCPKFGRNSKGHFSAEVYHSSDFNLKSLVSKSPEYDAYADLRGATEFNRYSFSDGIKIKYHRYNGLSIGLGLERSQINERFIYEDEDAREVRILIAIDTLFLPNGTFTTSSDTTRIDISGVKMNDILNKYTSIDLPINLSYTIRLNKWALGLNAGMHVNLLFTQKGRILGLDNNPAWINPGSKSEIQAFQPKSGLKFDGSISISYRLTENLDIIVEPYFKYNNNSFTIEKYQLNQFYNTVGIRTGARYNFGF